MTYRNPTREAIRQEQQDAALFDSVGLGWLASTCRRKAQRLQQTLLKSNRGESPKTRLAASA